MAAIEVREINKKFKEIAAINNLSFSVPENKIFGLLGSNGSGKTTTINMLTGLLVPDSGKITILGMDTSKHIEKIRQHIALVPQSISLYENLTIYENLEFFGGLYIRDKQKLIRNIDKTIEVLKLNEKKNSKISKLSGGYQRRCSIGCALISNPRILILDEPLAGVDAYTSVILMNFLKSLKETTIILTTHSIEEAEELCDYLVFMHKGKKILAGMPNQIVNYYSKYFGEQIFIEFDSAVEANEIDKCLQLEGFKIRNLKLSGNTVSFTSANLGSTIIDVLDSLKSVESHVLNIDIKKPTLENIFTYLVQHQK